MPPQTIDEKRAFLMSHGIALWDVIASCEITGSADSSIKNAVANDLSISRQQAIRQIFVTGRLRKNIIGSTRKAATGRAAIYLPSTSPNRSMDGRLIAAWRSVREAAQERDAQLAKLDAERLEDI